MISQIIDIQRKIRASLSIFYNKNELNNEREKKLSEEAKILGENILKSKRSNYKKTHKIFSNKTLNIILNKKLLNFLQYSFIQKMFLYTTDYF